MSGHQVHAHVHTTFVDLGAEMLEVVVGPVTHRDPVKISDVIARVARRRFKNRIEPNLVATGRIDIIKLRSDTRQVADPVAVRIVIALGIDLIKYRRLKPRRSRRNFSTNRCTIFNRQPKNGRENPSSDS